MVLFLHKRGVEINVELGHYIHLCRGKNLELGFFSSFFTLGEKTYVELKKFPQKEKENLYLY